LNLSDLPPHLRGVLVCALLLTIAISAGAFALSYVALDSIASQGGLHWSGLSWVFPFCIDALLIVSELALVAASCVTVAETGRPASRLLPFMFMLAFGATSIWLNTTRVPGDLRFVASIPPVASICGTILIAFLVKLLARSLGRQMTYYAPPPQMLTAMPPPSAVPGAIYRPSFQESAPYGALPPYGWPAAGQIPPSFHENGHNGQPFSGNGESKRRLVEEYLSGIAPEQLKALTARQIAADLTGAGYPVTERTVLPVLKQFRERHQRGSGSRKGGGS
jgi:hypothetical protein